MSIKKHIPNSITCCNLISGCIATCFAFFHEPELAMMWIIIGAVFDFFDGMSARALHVSSPIGKELDSLADDVTFGVAPSTILFSQLLVLDLPSALDPISSILPLRPTSWRPSRLCDWPSLILTKGNRWVSLACPPQPTPCSGARLSSRAAIGSKATTSHLPCLSSSC